MYKNVKTWTEDKPWLATSKLLVAQAAEEDARTIFRTDSAATTAWRSLVCETCKPLAAVVIRTAQDAYFEAVSSYKRKNGGRGGVLAVNTIAKVLNPAQGGSADDAAVACLGDAVDRACDNVLCEIFKRINEIHPLVGEALHALTNSTDVDRAEIGFKNLFFMRFVNVVLVTPEAFGSNAVGIDLKTMRGFDEEAFKMFLCAVSKEVMACSTRKFTTEPSTCKNDRWRVAILLFMQKVEDRQTWLKAKRPTVDLRSVVALAANGKKEESAPKKAAASRKEDRDHANDFSALPLKTSDHLPEGKRLRDLDCLELCKVLYALRLYELIQKVYDEGVTGDGLRKMNEEEMKRLGVTKRFQRERLFELQHC